MSGLNDFFLITETQRSLEICFFEKNTVKSKLKEWKYLFSKLKVKTTVLLLLSQHFQSIGKQQGCKTKAFHKKLPAKQGLLPNSSNQIFFRTETQIYKLMIK